MEERAALIALQRLKGIGPLIKKETALRYDLLGPVFEGKIKLPDKAAENRIRSFDGWKDIDRDLTKLEKMGAHVLTLRDAAYPPLLREIPDAPIVIYKKGTLPIGANTIAIVGSRKATFEGLNLAEKAGQTLSSLGITVVSGLARGIDGAGHKGALREKGKTVAVLGCGLDVVYPSENKRLYDMIEKDGCILTEYGPGELPLRHHFPQRNRIIAGISKAVLVIEASQRSGSLITARLGVEYGREVMAVPGSIFNDDHTGANALIKQGARLVTCIEDIVFGCFPDLEIKKEEQVDLDGDERYIYGIVGSQRVHVDEVIDKSGMETKRVMAILTTLEMKEVIRGLPGGFYLRI